MNTYLHEAFEHWHIVAALTVLGLVLAGVLYVQAGKPVGQVPIVGGDTINVVPASGDQGFPVLEFCRDVATIVTKGISPPDSEFAATYGLDRRSGGVHETVTVNVYADAAKQPVATHYAPDNTPSDAFVSKDAMKCITSKVR